jgi:hypothetical protein
MLSAASVIALTSHSTHRILIRAFQKLCNLLCLLGPDSEHPQKLDHRPNRDEDEDALHSLRPEAWVLDHFLGMSV